jgi:glycosyltransferase involved in cell wall biosynthesis
MADLCLITTCMGRLAHLQQSLPAAAVQPRCSCVVVDYSCPERAGDWVEQQYPTVKIVRVPGQAHFSPSRARNAGAAAADAPWLCFFDADVVLAPTFSERMLPVLTPGTFYTVAPWKWELFGTMICPHDAFRRAGGYDEVFAGWSGEDSDLCDRMLVHGFRRDTYPQELVTPLQHDDAERVRYHAVKSPQWSQSINMLYRMAKLDLMRLLGRDLSEHERHRLYAEAQRAAPVNERDGQLRIAFRSARSLLGCEVAATLVYTLRGAAPSLASPLNTPERSRP